MKAVYLLVYYDPQAEAEDYEQEVYTDLTEALRDAAEMQNDTGWFAQVVEVVVDPKGGWEDVAAHEISEG